MKRLFLTILCGVGLSLNLAVADTTTNLANSENVNSVNLSNFKNANSTNDIVANGKVNSQSANLQNENSTPTQTNQNLQSETKTENLTNQNLLSELDAQTLKELERYDRNLYNTPKTKQEKAELTELIEAITNADYNKTKEILDKNPSLVNLNLRLFYNPDKIFLAKL